MVLEASLRVYRITGEKAINPFQQLNKPKARIYNHLYGQINRESYIK